jgi:hypothetical protein
MGQSSGAWQQVIHPVSLCPGSMVWVILTAAVVQRYNNDDMQRRTKKATRCDE